MRKLTLLLLIALISSPFINAQEEEGDDGDNKFVSKKGVEILPKGGDIALGINAVPVLSFVGNTFNGTANNSTSFNFVDNTNAIYVKYFLDDETALRAKLRIAHNSIKDVQYIMKDTTPVPDSLLTVEDVQKTSATNITLNIGYEKRRGYGRIQGFYGGGLMLTYTTGKAVYDYGNSYGPNNTNPLTTNFGTNITANGRMLEVNNGSTFGAGLGGFIGVEYFIAPKFSIGGEFSWGLAMTFTGDGETTQEMWTGTEIYEYSQKTGGGNAINLDTGNAAGAIFLLFHF